MLEFAIIVQIREIAKDGRGGRIAVGFSKWKSETGTPQKNWSEYFFSALRRALLKRQDNVREAQRIADELPPLFREPF